MQVGSNMSISRQKWARKQISFLPVSGFSSESDAEHHISKLYTGTQQTREQVALLESLKCTRASLMFPTEPELSGPAPATGGSVPPTSPGARLNGKTAAALSTKVVVFAFILWRQARCEQKVLLAVERAEERSP